MGIRSLGVDHRFTDIRATRLAFAAMAVFVATGAVLARPAATAMAADPVTATIVAGPSPVGAASALTYTITFSEPVSDFDLNDDDELTLVGRADQAHIAINSPDSIVFHLSIVPVTSWVATTSITVGVPANVVTSTATGEPNVAAPSTATVQVQPRPTVTVNQGSTQSDPAVLGTPVVFDVVFSEAMTGFTSGDVTLTGVPGGTIPVVNSVDSTNFTVTVPAMATATATTITASVALGKATSSSIGNPNAASTSTDNSVTVGSPPPGVTINQVAPDPTNAPSVSFRVVFAQPVTGFDSPGDVTIGGTAATSTPQIVAESATTYTVTVPVSTPGTVTAVVPSGVATTALGVANAASTSTDNTITVDRRRPSVSVAATTGQPIPAGSSGVTFAITFSEVVTGFTLADIQMTGLTSGYSRNLSSADGKVWTLAITPNTPSGAFNATSVTIAIPADVATDLAGNLNIEAPVAATVPIDIVGPTVTINQAPAQPDPTDTSPVTFTVVFSEAVTGFGADDVVVSGTAGAATVTVTGATAIYQVAVAGMARDGTVIASVRANSATDGGGNGNVASTSTDHTVTLDTSAVVSLEGASQFVPLSPTRLFDTRPTEPGHGPKGIVGPAASIDVQVTGRSNVPDDAVAVVMNLTVTGNDAPSFVTAYPKGSQRPGASSLNLVAAGQTRANLVTVPIGDDGQVTIFSLAASHLLADVAGYYVAVDEPVAAGRFVAVTPQRLFDTRANASPGPKGKLDADTTIAVTVLGVGDIPVTGVSAIVVNVTATDASGAGFVTAFPNGDPVPLASNVNVDMVGTTAPNLAIVPIGDDGKISIYSSHGTHVLGDVTGYITDTTAAVATAGLFVPLVPERIFDTRPGETAPGPKGFVAANTVVDAVITGTVVPDDATAVVLNIAGIDSPLGFLTAWDTGSPLPTASTVNFVFAPLDTRANAAMLPLGDGGKISFYTLGGSDIIADVAGYFLR